ncbi:TlpA disulfide reductase family protein [Pedobacter sp. Hv1]|uniref:TlpA disulfide reductase family protein n=1 Tax=Pedobacter sp. Hv1 TaxID=1740090 RepID=UPI0006D8CE4B|nr:TlpA disulfide reductase family protein [Pedobacter sp. Hv1]KQC00879.1 hypothetical protein AQF98_09390 [Pedobacter sp. Hv1]
MKRNKISLVLALLLSSHLLQAQTAKSFRLQGKLLASATGYIYLYYPETDGRWKLDSSLLDKGNFVFKGGIATPTIARLSYAKSMTQVILEPVPMQVLIKDRDDLTRLSMTGSKSQHELNELNISLQKIEKRWKRVIDTLMAVNKRSNVAYQTLKDWVLDPYFKEVEETNHHFINKYPYSFASAYILQVFARELGTDSLQYFYNRFPAAVKQSRYGKNIAQQLAERKLGIPGVMAPAFAKEDINGKKLSLTDLKGKYVLLDFWGSWCVPCRKGNPHLIKLYEKYKNMGFEIIGIAADDRTPDAWRKAVADDKLPWLQVLQGDTPLTAISVSYNVTAYPTSILIDREGKIIGRFSEDHTPLDTMLENIFK